MKKLKLHKRRFKGVNVYAYSKGIITYGKNIHGEYRLELSYTLGLDDSVIKIYGKSKKPFIKDLCLLNVVAYPLCIVCLPFLFLYGIIAIYIEGAVNFVKDKAWQESVYEFNWANIFIIVLLIIALIFK